MLENTEINRIYRGFGSATAAIGTCIRCRYAYVSKHSTLLQCHVKEKVNRYNGVCSTEPFENCKSFKAGKVHKLNENTQTTIDFDI